MALDTAYLLDTNILLRIAKRDDAQHAAIKGAIQRLIEQGANLCYAPQNLVEFWGVVTRPKERNGFGLDVTKADREASLLERQFTLLPDDERIHIEWRRLVVAHSVSGKKVDDARLVALMRVHAVGHLLTLNTSDFSRYPGINPLHPGDVV